MTSRAKPTVRRSNRSGRDGNNRKNLFINLAFGVAAFIGIASLIGAAAATYFGAHFTEVGKVNGQQITQDTYRDRVKIDSFRLDQTEAQVRTQNQLGHLTDAEMQTRLAILEQRRQTIVNATLDELIDVTLMGQLATQQGITVSEANIDQRMTDEATQRELRHVSIISVKPEVTAGATTSTDAQKAAAKAKADGALVDIKGGKAFADIAKAVSTDSKAASGGDSGWIRSDDTAIDPALLAKLFTLNPGGLTDVMVGSDGTARIGQLVEIAPPTLDPTWTDRIKDAGVSVSAYREAVRGDLIREALTKKVLADATTVASVQRQVSEIFVSAGTSQATGDEVKVSHILYTPGDQDPGASTPPSADPGWLSAKAKAQATLDKLKALKPADQATAFAVAARTDSKDTTSGANGGELDWFTQDQLDTSFGDAVFKAGLNKGDLIGPVASQFGWHVILFEGRRGAPDKRIVDLQTQAAAAGADFAKLAKDNSDSADASTGGDLGWVAPYQLDAEREKAMFAAPIGKPSDVLKTSSGYYLFLVRTEQSRVPDATQVTTLNSTAFQNWYAEQKAKATITPDLTAGSS